jgi:ribosomal protein L3 glutamine methyltransferase
MDRRALESELARAAAYEQWVAVLTRYFLAHDLEYGHGTDNAADEAYWLVRHMQCWRDEPLSVAPEPELARRTAELAEKRAIERVPLAYLCGETWFAGLKFKVDSRVLIPRSPLAEVIEARFSPWCKVQEGDRILDIGTGSGCLAIAAAVHCPGTLVDATDVSAEALAVAAENVALHEVADRVRLHCTDLFPPADVRYRVIMSNPPYVPAGAVAALPAEYGYEPSVALDGGTTGLDIAARILRGAGARLMRDSILLVEVGAGWEAFGALHPRLDVTWVELTRGGDGVFVITAEELARSADEHGR